MKRVFILSRESMFSKGIETLLSREEEIEIVNRDRERSASLEYIQECAPDVVILNCDDPCPEISCTVLGILRDHLGFSVIGLSLQNNEMSVYHGEKKQVRQVEDLLKAIQD